MTQEELKTQLRTAYRNYTKSLANLAEASFILFTILDICKTRRDFLSFVSETIKAPPLLIQKIFRELKKSSKADDSLSINKKGNKNK